MVLCKKLRAAKVCCKALNRSKFNNIQKKSSDAFKQLEFIQSQLLTNPAQSLFEQEKQAQNMEFMVRNRRDFLQGEIKDSMA